jgi:hypothetical protein
VVGVSCEVLDGGPQDRQPRQQEAEVVSDSGHQCVDGVAGASGQVVAVHPVLCLEVANHRFDANSASRGIADSFAGVRFGGDPR